MSEESKRPWREKAKVEWEEHFSKHPDYKFRTRRKPKQKLRIEGGRKEGPLRKDGPSKVCLVSLLLNFSKDSDYNFSVCLLMKSINAKIHSDPLYEDRNLNQHKEFAPSPTHEHLFVSD